MILLWYPDHASGNSGMSTEGKSRNRKRSRIETTSASYSCGIATVNARTYYPIKVIDNISEFYYPIKVIDNISEFYYPIKVIDNISELLGTAITVICVPV